MNDTLIKLALDAHLINYVDNETPRRYFICGNADLEEVETFAHLVAKQERDAVIDNILNLLNLMDDAAAGNHNYYRVVAGLIEAEFKH